MARNKNKQLIEQMRRIADGHRSFEMPGFEASLDKTKIPVRDSLAEFTQIQNKMSKGTQLPDSLNLPNSSPTPGNVNAAAQFTIQVTRETAAIAVPLPVAIFAPVYASNGWRSFLQGQMPAGVTLSKVEGGERDGLPDSVQFEFTQGLNTDVVTVRCSTAPYPAFLESLVTDRFDVNKVRFTLSDPAQVAQFAQQVLFSTRSMFGLGSQNPVTPDNFRSPQQYQAGIVDVDVDAKFDKQTGIILPIVPVAQFSVSCNIFSPRFYMQSAKYW